MENAMITRDDLSEIEVKVEPILNDKNEEAGCYSLYIGGDYQGQICFKPDDKYIWDFINNNLTYREQNQIVSHIQTQI